MNARIRALRSSTEQELERRQDADEFRVGGIQEALDSEALKAVDKAMVISKIRLVRKSK